MFPSVYGALSPAAFRGLLPPGFVEPYHSLHFAALYISKTAVVFSTLDLFLLLLSGEHEDDRDTLCMVPGLKGAGAASVSNHSLLLCSSSSFPSEEEGVCFSFTHHPVISLLIPLSLYVCSRTLATEFSIHDFGVCFPPNGFTSASMIAPLTTPWYFLIFISVPKMRFTTGSIVPHARVINFEVQCQA